MNRISFETLYHKYLQNQMSEEELSDFLAQIQQPGKEERLGELMEQTWHQMYELPVQEQQHSPSPVRRLWVILAAAIVLFALVGSWLLFFNKPAAKPELAKKSVPATDVPAPDAFRATLQLADGSIVYLDEAKNGTVAMQGAAKVVKTEKGEVVYETGKADNAPVAYNTLFNPRGSKVFPLQLSDGTRVWLNSESSVKYPVAFKGSERIVEITGEAYFEVAHKASQPFKVKKGEVEVTVLGTHFNINAYDDEEAIKVTLLQGSVKVSNKGATAIIKPGEQAVATTNHKLQTTNAVDLESTMAWKNGLFSFNKTDLTTIMRQAARWYDVDVHIKDGLGSIKFSGDIGRGLSLRQFLGILEETRIHYTLEGKNLTITQ